ncbi:fumarylacetoacetate hydrolase family protein [Microbacterium sp. NPDC055683]
MRLATLRLEGATRAVRIDGDVAVEIDGAADVGALLRDTRWKERSASAQGRSHDIASLEDAQWAPPVVSPGKIVCVGLNYRNHIREMGRELPEFPTLFAKYPEALIGPYDVIELPAAAADAVDWEAELGIVVGAVARRAGVEQAAAAIAGYTVVNDVTMRDYQYRTPEWFQGKTFEATTPIGPVVVTPDEYELGTELSCAVDGETVQSTRTDDLVFGPAQLVAYISQIFTLQPGDVIASGTPGGVGHARTPRRYLQPGAVLTTSVGGIGELRNEVTAEKAS